MPENVDVTRDQRSMPQGRIDPDVKLPESVKRQIEAANTAIAAVQQQPEPAPAPAPVPVAAAPSAPNPEPSGVAPAPTTPPTPAPAPAPVPAAEPEPSRETFSGDPDLQGKYDRMVQSMNGRLKQRDDTISGMQGQLDAMGQELQRMTAMLEQRGTSPQPTAPAPITDADREFAGDQLLEIVSKVVDAKVAPVMQQQQNVQKTQQRTAAQNFYASLDQSIPDWRELNRNEEFKSWLRLPDVYAGRVRQALLNEAVKAADAPRAIAFFKGFKSEKGLSPSPQPTPEPQPAPQRQAATTLEALAAPGRAQPAGSQTPAPVATEKPTYTRQDISNFYAHKRLFPKGQGIYAGKEAEMNATERDIVQAQHEGRIKG